MPNDDADFFALIDKEPKETTAPVQQRDDADFFNLINDDPVATQARANLNITQDINPDKEAENYSMAVEARLPVSTVRLVPEEVKKKLEQPVDMSRASQAMLRYFANGHSNAAMSRDDVNALNKVEATIDKSKGTLERLRTESPTLGGIARTATAAVAFGAAEVPKAIGNIFDFVAPLIVDKRKLDYRKQQPITLSKDVQGWMREQYGDTKAEELIGSAFESLGTMAAVLVTGGEAAVLPGISAISGIGKTTEAIASGKDRATAVVAGITSAATEYLTEKIPLDILRAPATSFIKKLALGIATDVPGELISTATEMWLIDQNILGGEHKSREEYKQALIDTAIVSGIMTTAATAPIHAVQKVLGDTDNAKSKAVEAESLAVDNSKQFTENITEERAAISESLTAQRSKDHIKEFIKNVDGDEDVQISSDGLNKFYQSHHREEADTFLKNIGIEPSKAQESISTGEDVSVKVNEIRTMAPEDYAKIKDDIKPAPGAYTQREIQEDKANEDVTNLVNLVKEDVEETKLVSEQITRIQEEGKQAGLPQDTIDNAPILVQGIANKLKLEGVDTVEFLKKIGFKKATLVDKVKGLFQADTIKRGAIDLDNERHTIHLFEGADMSTVLHEVGHVALKEYMNLEDTGQASDSLKADMSTLREWVGIEEGQAFDIPHIEQIARGFEAYLMEGKAPTKGLAAAFERFKHFLVNTYKSAKALGVTLTPQVRQVFDRMISTNLEVEAMAATGGFLIKTKEEMNALGLTKKDQDYATKLIGQTTKKAERRLSQARNKNYKDNIKKLKEESRREIRNEFPIYNIIDSIIKDGHQLDRDTFLEAGQGDISELPTSRLLKKDGANIDMVAALYGFDDAQTMISLFLATPNFTESVNLRVEQKVAQHDAQFQVEDYIVDLPEYRDYLNVMARYISKQTVDEKVIIKGIQDNIKRWEKESREEITEEQPDLTGNELQKAITDRTQTKIDNWQIKKGKPAVISNDTIKSIAADTMAAKSVKDAQRVDKYLSAMKKAANDERRAIMRKDWGAASEASETARFNYEMAGLSVKVRDEVDTIQKRVTRIAKKRKVETVDFEHKEAILHLANRYNLASVAPRDPNVNPDYDSLFAGDDYGNDGFATPNFLNTNISDFRDLRVEQLRELDNAIRYLEGQGRIDKKEFLSDGNTRLNDVVDESVDVQNKVIPKKVWEKGSMMRKLSDVSRNLFAMLDSLTFIAKSLDGYTNLGKEGVKGPAERFIIDRIKEAGAELTKHGVEIRDMVAPHLNQISKTVMKWHKKFGSHIQIEGVPVPALMRADGQTKGWKAQQIFAVVLNTGNLGESSNYENLLAGYSDLTPAMIDKIKSMLSVEDMRAVQGIWDAINSLFPKVDAQHLKTKNYHMPKVQATPFTFKGEQFEGGYYPIKHDRDLSYKVDDRGKVEDLFNKDAAGFMTPYAKSGHTIKRLEGVALPILLDLSVIDSHFRDTLQYIHFSDAIRDADRITRDPEFREAATRILGKDVYNTIRPALEHIVNPVKAGVQTPFSRGIEKMRGMSTAYVLAWNTGVAIKQPLSTFSAIRDMGAKAYLAGFSSAFMSPAAHYQKMIDLSPYMRDRLTSFDREVKSQFLKLSGEQRGVYFGDSKVTWQDVKNFGFWQIRIADTTTVLPIWHGAFNDKLLDDQSNLQEAISYADDIVRNSQPSAQPLDLSAWQRDGGAVRLFSQFQTFTVGKYGQRQRLFYKAWRNGTISNADYAWFNFMDAFVPLVAINLLQSLLWGNDLGDDETQKDIMVDVLQSWAFMGVPIVSNVARSAFRYGDPFDSPVFTTANKATRGVLAGVKGLNGFENRKEREQALWGIAHTVSILSGVPVSKIVQRAEKGAAQKKGVPGIKYLIPAPRK